MPSLLIGNREAKVDQADRTKSALPPCGWVYFATTAKECWTVTKEFVSEAKIIFAHAYNTAGIRMVTEVVLVFERLSLVLKHPGERCLPLIYQVESSNSSHSGTPQFLPSFSN